jgi:hypothetical protein
LGIGGSGLIAKSWVQSGCDLAIKTFSSYSGDDFFFFSESSLGMLVQGVFPIILSNIALASLVDK